MKIGDKVKMISKDSLVPFNNTGTIVEEIDNENFVVVLWDKPIDCGGLFYNRWKVFAEMLHLI